MPPNSQRWGSSSSAAAFNCSCRRRAATRFCAPPDGVVRRRTRGHDGGRPRWQDRWTPARRTLARFRERDGVHKRGMSRGRDHSRLRRPREKRKRRTLVILRRERPTPREIWCGGLRSVGKLNRPLTIHRIQSCRSRAGFNDRAVTPRERIIRFVRANARKLAQHASVRRAKEAGLRLRWWRAA